MDRRLAFTIGVGFIWPLWATGVAQAQQAQCREETVVCESACIDQPAEDCRPVCRSIVVCEVERDRAPDSRLPDDALPESRLPKSRLPGGNLPDSTFN